MHHCRLFSIASYLAFSLLRDCSHKRACGGADAGLMRALLQALAALAEHDAGREALVRAGQHHATFALCTAAKWAGYLIRACCVENSFELDPYCLHTAFAALASTCSLPVLHAASWCATGNG